MVMAVLSTWQVIIQQRRNTEYFGGHHYLKTSTGKTCLCIKRLKSFIKDGVADLYLRRDTCTVCFHDAHPQ